MSPDNDPSRNPADSDEYGDFVSAVFARDADEAERYCELLNDHDIPAILGVEEAVQDTQGEEGEAPIIRRRGIARGIPVMVPDEFLEEASEIIAERDTLGDFEDEDDEEEEDEDEDELPFGHEIDEDEDDLDDLDEEDEEDGFLEDDFDDEEL